MVEHLIRLCNAINGLGSSTNTMTDVANALNDFTDHSTTLNVYVSLDAQGRVIVNHAECQGCLWQMPAQEDHMDPATGCLRGEISKKKLNSM